VSPGVFSFDHDHGVPARELGELLGGKGAGLAEMTALGFDVPPGFTISLPVCRRYLDRGWPTALDADLAEHVAALGDTMGRRLGDANDPLLVAVRSGAPVSMPGMLDTVLNLGLNEDTVRGLVRTSDDEWFAWDSYRRFLTMYATTVMGIDAESVRAEPSGRDTVALRDLVAELRERIERLAGRPVPHDPIRQLREAVEAVFRSWGSNRAKAYRRREGIADDAGTGCNIQAMVFGNRGPRSGTGVVFTRDPATGAPHPYGDYLPRAQGEDVVSGTARTLPLTRLAEQQPGVHAQLTSALRRLEVHYRDICDVEFTIEEGKLWLLQTRIGKRTATAAVRIAVDLVDDEGIRLTTQEALDRVPPPLRVKARAEVVTRCATDGAADSLLTTGLGASPGRVSGRVVFSAEEAFDADDDVILVRTETSPEDVAGMSASVGILTTRGGLVSHAAVVARGWNLPAVVGADQIVLEGGALRTAAGAMVRAGELITIDGATGRVWRGAVPASVADQDAVARHLPQLDRLEKWARDREVSPA
jgi:pyruvate,orthophosphate dikinase